MHKSKLLLIGLLWVAPCTFADDKPASQPTTAGSQSVIAAGDKDALTANMNKEATIEGTIDKAEWSSTGKVMKATFKEGADTKVAAIVFVKNRDKFDQAFSGHVSKALTGAKVRLKGKLKEFKGSPEIVLDDVNQVTIVEAAPAQ